MGNRTLCPPMPPPDYENQGAQHVQALWRRAGDPLHLLNECPATLDLRVAWETLLRNPDHAKCSPILSMTERLLFFAKEPRIKQLMTRENEQAVLMLAHPMRHPYDREAGSPQNPGDPSNEYQAQPGANYTLSSPSMVSSEED